MPLGHRTQRFERQTDRAREARRPAHLRKRGVPPGRIELPTPALGVRGGAGLEVLIRCGSTGLVLRGVGSLGVLLVLRAPLGHRGAPRDRSPALDRPFSSPTRSQSSSLPGGRRTLARRVALNAWLLLAPRRVVVRRGEDAYEGALTHAIARSAVGEGRCGGPRTRLGMDGTRVAATYGVPTRRQLDHRDGKVANRGQLGY